MALPRQFGAIADRRGPFGNLAAAVLMNQGQRAAGEVAQAVREVGIVALDQRVVTEVAVLAEDHLAQQVIPQGIGAEGLLDGRGAHHVALGLAHLVVFEEQPAVGEKRLGKGRSAAHKNAGQ